MQSQVHFGTNSRITLYAKNDTFLPFLFGFFFKYFLASVIAFICSVYSVFLFCFFVSFLGVPFQFRFRLIEC